MADDNINISGGFEESADKSEKLKEQLREILDGSRDISAEANQIAQALSMSNVEAAKFRKSFKDTHDISKRINQGFDQILDGTRKQKDVEKDIAKNLQAEKSIRDQIKLGFDKFVKGSNDLTKTQKEEIKNAKTQEQIQNVLFKYGRDMSKEQREHINLSQEQLGINLQNKEALEDQIELLEKGETPLKKSLETFSAIAGKLGMGALSQPMAEAAEAARVAAINGADFKEQMQAAAAATEETVTKMLMLAMVSAGLQFSKEATLFQKNMALSNKEALELRMHFTALSNDLNHAAISSAQIGNAFATLQHQFGDVASILRDDIVQETARLMKLTDMSAESASRFAIFANISGKNAAVITKEARRAVVNAEQEKGLRLDINKVLNEAGKITGQISAQLAGNVVEISKAVALAQQYGMTLQQVAKSGNQLLNFEQSINNELEAELLTGRQLNLERARLAALTGDYELLTREINKNIGDFGDFSRLNVLQQRALAQSVGMTADELSNVLLQQENIEQLAEEARAAGDEDLAKQLEKRALQERFTDAVDKMKQIFVDIVGGPVGTLLGMFASMLEGIVSIFGWLGLGESKLFNWVATAGMLLLTFVGIKKVFTGLYSLTKGLFKFQKLKAIWAGKEAAMHGVGLGVQTAEKGVRSSNNALALTGVKRSQGKALADSTSMVANMGAKSFGVGAVIGAAILAGIVGMFAGMMMTNVGDLNIPGDGGPIVFSPSENKLFQGSANDGLEMSPSHGGGIKGGGTPGSHIIEAFAESSANITAALNSGFDRLNNTTAQNKPHSLFHSSGENDGETNIRMINHGIVGDAHSFS